MNIILALFILASAGLGSSGPQEGNLTAKLQASLNTAMIQGMHQNNSQGHGRTEGKGQGQNGIKPNTTAIDPQVDAPKVKGIYVTAYSAGGSRMNQLVDLLDKTDLNAMVIDIKDDEGYITYKTDNPKLKELGKSQPFIKDIKQLMKRLEKHDIYPIARVVVFKDTILAKKTRSFPSVKAMAPYGPTAAATASSTRTAKRYGITTSRSPKKLPNSDSRKSSSIMFVFPKVSRNGPIPEIYQDGSIARGRGIRFCAVCPGRARAARHPRIR